MKVFDHLASCNPVQSVLPVHTVKDNEGKHGADTGASEGFEGWSCLVCGLDWLYWQVEKVSGSSPV